MASGYSLRNVAIILLAILLSSCGIDTISFLESKVTRTSSDPSSIIFTAPAFTESSYLGVFLFYRIYDSESSATNDRNSLDSRQNALNSVPGGNIESFLLAPGGLNYKKIVINNKADIPSLDTDLFTTYMRASIEFPASVGDEPNITLSRNNTADVVYSIRRSVLDQNSNYYSFRDRPLNEHEDYAKSANDDNPNEYYIQFFAATYGVDFNDFSDLYGDAVYLGLITLNI